MKSLGPTVAIRVDSGAHIGGGHLLRCLTLAEELRRRGASVRFISREHPGHLLSRLEDSAYTVHRLPAPRSAGAIPRDGAAWLGATSDEDARQTLTGLRGERIDWLVVDHYGIGAEWERRAGAVAERVMVIDDLANRTHDAALLVDQNYFGSETAQRYDRLITGHCRVLLGPRYALLHPDYRRLRSSRTSRSGTVRRVLVFFGMNDQTGALPKVLQALHHPEFRGIEIDVVIGNDLAERSEVHSLARALPRVTIHEQMPNLAELTAAADLAIGACGATTWERACLGVPVVVATIAHNQVALANTLAAEGFIVLLGQSTSTPSFVWRIVLRELIKNQERIGELGARMRVLTDGHGAGRVAVRMFDGVQKVIMRPCVADDEALLLEWANDAQTRYFAFNKNPIIRSEHHQWFLSRRQDPDCAILIGEDPYGLPLGQVRFDLNRTTDEATINISVDVALRGTGIGTLLLRGAIDRWRKDYPHTPIIAEVFLGNEASRRMFTAAGFSVAATRRPKTITFESRPA